MATPYQIEQVEIELVRQEIYPFDDNGKRIGFRERAKRLLEAAQHRYAPRGHGQGSSEQK